MKQYLLRRLVLTVPTLGLVSLIVFGMMRLMPGDVVTRMVEGQAYAPTIEALRKDLGLDRPAYVQYLDWIGGILRHGDFGNSYWTRQPIWDEFARRFPVTLELAILTILVSVVIGILVGIVSAARQDSWGACSRSWRSRCPTSAWPCSWWCCRRSTSSGHPCGPTCP
jgi:ABC-type dipeptide/oligopeptide/nickel transport system permease component